MSILDQHWETIRHWPCTSDDLRNHTLAEIVATDPEVAIVQDELLSALDRIEVNVLGDPAEIRLDPALFRHMEQVVLEEDSNNDAYVLCVLHRAMIMHLMGTFLNTVDATRATNSGAELELRLAARTLIDEVESETVDAQAASTLVYAMVWAAQKIGMCDSTQFPTKPQYCD